MIYAIFMIINFGSKNQNSLNISQENINVLENENYVEMDDILFLEEQVININENDNYMVRVKNLQKEYKSSIYKIFL